MGRLLFLLILLGTLAAQAAPRPTLRAFRVTRAPGIDGRLDEAAWRAAPAATAFVQRSPDDGAAPDQRSELRVLYDGAAVYVGLRLWDRHPELIRRGLTVRDNVPDSDFVVLYLDPLLTGERGYYFQVNASGVMADGLIYQEVVEDSAWDASWSAAARVDEKGWTAELRIPLTSIAFQDRQTQSWGIAVDRHVQRDKQISCWPPIPKDSNTFVSRFARLAGLEGLRRGQPLQLRPYVAAEVQLQRAEGSLRPDESLRPNGGLDLLYGSGGALMLHLALNPDFGQVEDDVAVVNLGPDEVYYNERRPFFVAGADLFRTPIGLLHTRRIGARPAAPEARTEEGEIVEVDPEARIAGALKAVGRAGPVDYGALGALVLPTDAVEETGDGERVERQATPGRHYGAGRLRFRLGQGASSSVGLLMTGMTHLDREANAGEDAYAGGLDWDLRSRSGWQTTGQVSGATAQEGRGYGLWASAGQRGARRWRYWLEAESFSRDYEINDVGYQWRANMVRLRPYLMRRLPVPWRFVREAYALLWGQYAFQHEAPEIAFDRRVELTTYAKLKGLWGIWGGVGHRLFTLDDRETRGGPVYPRPREVYGWVGGETDTSRRLVLEATCLVAAEGDSLKLKLEGYVRAALWDRLSLTLYWRWLRMRDFPRWLETVDEAGERVRYIFGDLDQDELELRLSALLGLRHDLSLTLFSQLLHSAGAHDHFRELYLLDDGSTTLGPTSRTAEADFTDLSLILNAILRWDLGGGAAAYLVYKLAADLSREGAEAAGFDLSGSLSGLWDRDQTHLLLVKASYNF